MIQYRNFQKKIWKIESILFPSLLLYKIRARNVETIDIKG